MLPHLMQELDLINQISYHKEMEKCLHKRMKLMQLNVNDMLLTEKPGAAQHEFCTAFSHLFDIYLIVAISLNLVMYCFFVERGDINEYCP